MCLVLSHGYIMMLTLCLQWLYSENCLSQYNGYLPEATGGEMCDRMRTLSVYILIGWEHCLYTCTCQTAHCGCSIEWDMYWSCWRMLFGWNFQVNGSASAPEPSLFSLLGYHTTPLCALLHLHNRVDLELESWLPPPYLIPIGLCQLLISALLNTTTEYVY